MCSPPSLRIAMSSYSALGCMPFPREILWNGISREFRYCSRICNGQSTPEPQGSTGIKERTVKPSIESTYFHPIPTDFHNRSDLVRDQGVGGSNPLSPTNIVNHLLTSVPDPLGLAQVL